MGGAASKVNKGARKYPSPSSLPSQSIVKGKQIPSPAQVGKHSLDGRAPLDGDLPMNAPTARMPTGFDPKLAARLHELGPVTVPHVKNKVAAKVFPESIGNGV
jgi:hypothetical protein